MSFGSKYSKLHLARKFKFICFVKRRCSLRSQCWKMRLFVVTFKHCVASFLKVCSRQPFAGHRCQKRDKNSAPTLDCLHGGIPHLVLRFGLYYVRLQHDSRLRCGCGYSPTLQLYHHDRVRKNTKRFLSFQKKSTKPKNWFTLKKSPNFSFNLQ